MTKEFVLSLESRPGTFAEALAALAKDRVNVEGVAAYNVGEMDIARIVTNDDARAEAALLAARVPFRAFDVLLVDTPDVPGALQRVCATLAKSGVNIEAVYGRAAPEGRSAIVLRTDDDRSARKALGL